jgi:hypothetical protein
MERDLVKTPELLCSADISQLVYLLTSSKFIMSASSLERLNVTYARHECIGRVEVHIHSFLILFIDGGQ